MENSQSSDVFSDTSMSCSSSTEIMNVVSYDSLYIKTKAAMTNVAHVGKVSFPGYFSSLLNDCRTCIRQKLDLIVKIALDGNTKLDNISQCIEDAVCLLQLLSNLIKTLVESVSVSCCSFKTFPTTTGDIILLVFTHCKNSESVYGVHLNDVQKQLKDLFRSCHELQLTYLMVLEKHFMFNLSEEEQLDILIEALAINLKIGEVVQSLDVKTMAEQWKAYMALCEKYTCHLSHKAICKECTQLLCTMIRNNLSNAMEINQEDKVVIRSLKVTNFTIKILTKICVIFKQSPMRDYSNIFDLLIYIYLNTPAYLECVQSRSPSFVNAVSTNISIPTNIILGELIMDEKFMNVVLTYSNNEYRDEKLLGFVLLTVAVAKCILVKSNQMPSIPKHKLLHNLFKLLPECHIWLNIGMKFKGILHETEHSIGLFEYMLIYAISLAITLDGEELCQLEKIMYEAILGTHPITALFSSNLWTAMSRLNNNRQLLFSQVLFMCQSYQKLETHKSFSRSPQRIHISYAMQALFEAMRTDDRIRIFKQFCPIEQRNFDLWSVLKIKNLPKELQRRVQEEIVQRYRTLQCSLQTGEDLVELIQLMKLLSTMSSYSEDEIEECLVEAWMRACPTKYQNLYRVLDSGMLWYLNYIEAVVLWTSTVENAFRENSVNLYKVLHVISIIIIIDNTELNLLLIDLLCKLATIPVQSDNKHSVVTLLNESFRCLVHDSTDSVVKKKLLRTASAFNNRNLDEIICSLVTEELQEMWDYFKGHRVSSNNNVEKLKETLLATCDMKYVHKCLHTRELDHNSETVKKVQKAASSNFDFADLDTLFDNESDTEPANKKIKMDDSEAESILIRLESDATLLCNVKENMFNSGHRRRIKVVCEKLQSLIT